MDVKTVICAISKLGDKDSCGESTYAIFSTPSHNRRRNILANLPSKICVHRELQQTVIGKCRKVVLPKCNLCSAVSTLVPSLICEKPLVQNHDLPMWLIFDDLSKALA